jgi:type III pantothenate kinase
MARSLCLIVDVGNQDTVVGFLSTEGNVIGTARIPTARRSTSELEMWLEFVCREHKIAREDFIRVAVASVVPSHNQLWSDACEELLDLRPWFLSAATVSSFLMMEVDRPQEVGADRLANALAVIAGGTLENAAVVMDFGTAATFDVISPDGVYVGGVIAPGMNVALESLGNRTALLPRLAFAKTQSVIGRNTVDAMTAGAYFGFGGLTAGIMKRLDEDMRGRWKKTPRYFATGGQAALVCSALDRNDVVIDPELTLKGIFHGAQRSYASLA